MIKIKIVTRFGFFFNRKLKTESITLHHIYNQQKHDVKVPRPNGGLIIIKIIAKFYNASYINQNTEKFITPILIT